MNTQRNNEHQLIGTCTGRCCQPGHQTSELEDTAHQLLGAIHYATHQETFVQGGRREGYNQLAAERWAVYYAKKAARLAKGER